MEIDKLVISIQLQADQMQEQLASLQDKVTKFGKQSKQNLDDSFDSKKFKESTKKIESIISDSTKNIVGILKGGLVGVGVALGVDFALDFVHGVTKQGLSLQSASAAFGVSTDNLQLVQGLYKRFGGSAEAGTSDIANLYKQLTSPGGSARFGQAAVAFQQYGQTLNATDANGKLKDAGALLVEILQKSTKLPYTVRSSVFQLLGLNDVARAAAKDPQLLNRSIADVRREGFRTKESIDKEAEMERRFQNLSQRWELIGADIADKFLPLLELITSYIEKVLHPLDTLKAIDHDLMYPMGKFSGTSNDAFSVYRKPLSSIESSGGKDPRAGNNEFQVTEIAAKDVFPNLTHDQWLANKNNPAFLEEASRLYFDKAYKLAGGDPLGARAYYNGGPRGLSNYNRTGVATSPYDQQKWQNILSTQNSIVNHHHNIAMNMANVNLPQVTNPAQFANEMKKMSTTAYAFSGNVLA